MLDIYIDADGCPVKEEVYRVARRYEFSVVVVSNSRMRVPDGGRVEFVLVKEGFDAADDWIVQHIKKDDIVISADIPLASRCLEKGASAIDPKGREFTGNSIGDALATRELMSYLREMGSVTGGPAPFEARDRSRFLARLDEVIQRIRKKSRK
jgi:uncharacterized protein YaiI (UPF0178 family)